MNRQAQADKLGKMLSPARLHPAVLQWAAKRRPSEGWCVALSGGADSVALLLLLCAHWPEKKDQLVALHFDHGQRGRTSTADAKFCQTLCRSLGIKCVVGVWRGAKQGASEAELRVVRQVFFERAMAKLRSKVLWLAHQQDDIAETQFMRLARGSGTAGLAAPRPVQVFGTRVHVRPLLTLKKQELTDVLRSAKIKWREDRSNAGQNYFRNRIRQAVLPAWQKAAARDAIAGAARSRELLEEDDLALEAWLDSFAALKRGVLDLAVLEGAPLAILRRALHRWLLAVQPETDLSRQGFELLLAALARAKATRFSLGRSGFAVIRQGKLIYRKA